MADATEAVDHVLDASAIVKLLIEEPGSAAFREWYLAEIQAGATFAAPGILAYEVAQVIAKRLVPPANAKASAWWAERHDEAMTGIGLDHGAAGRAFSWMPTLSGYDASYLATAVATRATLVSYDDALLKEARKSGIRTLTPR